jgi:hypothetical protein
MLSHYVDQPPKLKALTLTLDNKGLIDKLLDDITPEDVQGTRAVSGLAQTEFPARRALVAVLSQRAPFKNSLKLEKLRGTFISERDADVALKIVCELTTAQGSGGLGSERARQRGLEEF